MQDILKQFQLYFVLQHFQESKRKQICKFFFRTGFTKPSVPCNVESKIVNVWRWFGNILKISSSSANIFYRQLLARTWSHRVLAKMSDFSSVYPSFPCKKSNKMTAFAISTFFFIDSLPTIHWKIFRNMTLLTFFTSHHLCFRSLLQKWWLYICSCFDHVWRDTLRMIQFLFFWENHYRISVNLIQEKLMPILILLNK